MFYGLPFIFLNVKIVDKNGNILIIGGWKQKFDEFKIQGENIRYSTQICMFFFSFLSFTAE